MGTLYTHEAVGFVRKVPATGPLVGAADYRNENNVFFQI